MITTFLVLNDSGDKCWMKVPDSKFFPQLPIIQKQSFQGDLMEVIVKMKSTSLFQYKSNCKCYKKLASRLWCMLFTLTYFYFTLTHKDHLFCWKIKSCCDCCFPQQIRPQIYIHLYILQVYSSVSTSFNMINKCHTVLVVYTMLV